MFPASVYPMSAGRHSPVTAISTGRTPEAPPRPPFVAGRAVSVAAPGGFVPRRLRAAARLACSLEIARWSVRLKSGSRAPQPHTHHAAGSTRPRSRRSFRPGLMPRARTFARQTRRRHSRLAYFGRVPCPRQLAGLSPQPHAHSTGRGGSRCSRFCRYAERSDTTTHAAICASSAVRDAQGCRPRCDDFVQVVRP